MAVVIETGAKRVFASSLDWPGWSRSGPDEADALEAPARYAPRYRPVARAAGSRLMAHVSFSVVDRVPGGATTDFGAPGTPAAIEARPPTPAEARRLVALLRAAWEVLAAAASQSPAAPQGAARRRA